MSEMTYCLFVLQNFVMTVCRAGDKNYLFRFYVDGYTTKVYNIYVCLIENSERKD